MIDMYFIHKKNPESLSMQIHCFLIKVSQHQNGNQYSDNNTWHIILQEIYSLVHWAIPSGYQTYNSFDWNFALHWISS